MLLVMRGSQSTECAGGLAPVVNFPTACSVAWEIRIPTAATFVPQRIHVKCCSILVPRPNPRSGGVVVLVRVVWTAGRVAEEYF
eukprot:8128974-Pyramimonas_sp.AAC.2